MNNKIPIAVLALSIFQYFNQGFSGMPGDCLYYLTRESWMFSATQLAIIGLAVGIPWYIKLIWGYWVDRVLNVRKALIVAYGLLIASYVYIVIFGLNYWSLIITGLLINSCIAFSDTTVDKQMVIAEQKYDLKSRLQSLQWAALGLGGLVVALLGAGIAKYLPEPLNYKVAYIVAGIVPLLFIGYLLKMFKAEPTEKTPIPSFKECLSALKNKQLLWGLLFIAALQFCPSFGTALNIKMREVLHVDKMFLGVLGAIGTVLGLVGYIIYYKFAYKFPIKKLLYFTVIFGAITNLFYLYIPNQWYLLGYNILFGAFGGITFMALLRFFVTIIPSGKEALFYALVTSVSNFCGRGGGFIGGVIFDNSNYETTVIVSTITTLLTLLIIPKLIIKEDLDSLPINKV